ncbi:12658_t:CDS:2 [Acaulospora morrowiae]|uniref:12658_t:CDS:1 n=1 Tax=Acaulospora morrowiae TaxID=94023 RepID=A0A9N8VGZ9_9GLOM|nr:12658_t:CDS:2 [Acaulospora morrowiae]
MQNQLPYNSSLLRITLPSLISFTDHHRELVELAVKNSSKRLVIYVSCKDIGFYEKTPLKCWNEVHNLLSAFYVSGTRMSYELSRPFLEIDVIFEDWCGYSAELEKEWNLEVLFGNDLERTVLEKFNENRKAAGLVELPIHIMDTITSPPSQIGLNFQNSIDKKLDDDKPQIFQKVAVGGTFDHLHVGHKILLTMSAWTSTNKLICGVTGDVMLINKKYKEYMESIDTRIEKTAKFLNNIRRGLLYEVGPIYDPYGPTITDPDVEALIVSKETVSGADSINEERRKRGLNPLEILVIEVISSSAPSLKDEDFKNLKISSTFIREMLSKNSG